PCSSRGCEHLPAWLQLCNVAPRDAARLCQVLVRPVRVVRKLDAAGPFRPGGRGVSLPLADLGRERQSRFSGEGTLQRVAEVLAALVKLPALKIQTGQAEPGACVSGVLADQGLELLARVVRLAE